MLQHKRMFLGIGAAIVLSFIMHLPHLKKDLMGMHVWRQAQTQNTVISFYEEDMNILNPRRSSRGNTDGIFRMELPLMQWLIASAYKATGEHIVVTRLYMFCIYAFGIMGFGLLGYIFFQSRTAGVIGAWAFSFSPEMFYFGINPLPDVMAVSITAWGLYFIMRYRHFGQLHNWVIGCLLLMLAALVKLPFVLFFGVPFCYLLQLFWPTKSVKAIGNLTAVAILALLPVAAWYVPAIVSWQGNGIVGGVLASDTSFAVLYGYLIHHLFSTIPELLVNYAAMPLMLFAFYQFIKQRKYLDARFSLLLPTFIAVTAYFLYELNMIEKVHDYYLFPFYPFIIITVVYGALSLWQLSSWRWLVWLLVLALPITAGIRTANSWDEQRPGFNADLLLHKQELQAAAPDYGLCVVGNDISQHIWFYYLHKKGWAFDQDNFDVRKLQEKINLGARYLYTDSKLVSANKEIIPLLDTLLLQRGTIMVYKLKNYEGNK